MPRDGVTFARTQPVSTATRIDLPSRISSRIRSKKMMNESAVTPTAMISPAMPGNVRVKFAVSLSSSTSAYVAAAATSSEATTTRPRPR